MGRRKFEGSDWNRFLLFVESFNGAEGILPITLREKLGFDKKKSKAYLHRAYKRGILIRRKDKRHWIVHGVYDKVVQGTISSRKLQEEISSAKKEEPAIPAEATKVIERHPSPPSYDAVSKTLPPPKVKPADIKWHAHLFVLKKSYLDELSLKRSLIDHSSVDPITKEFIVEKIPLSELFEPVIKGAFNPHAISSIWDLKGYKENEYAKSFHHSIAYDRGRNITFEVYMNNTVNIYIECSNNPLNAMEVLMMYQTLKAFIQSACHLDVNQLEEFIILKKEETNVDMPVGKTEIEAIPNKCITMRDYMGNHIREYLKDIDGETVLRTESIRERSINAKEWRAEMNALRYGGLPGEVMAHQVFAVSQDIKHLTEEISGTNNKLDKYIMMQTISPMAMERLFTTLDKLDTGQRATASVLAQVASRLAPQPAKGTRKRRTRPESPLNGFDATKGEG